MKPTFKSLEHEGWSERADAYDEYTACFTNYGACLGASFWATSSMWLLRL